MNDGQPSEVMLSREYHARVVDFCECHASEIQQVQNTGNMQLELNEREWLNVNNLGSVSRVTQLSIGVT